MLFFFIFKEGQCNLFYFWSLYLLFCSRSWHSARLKAVLDSLNSSSTSSTSNLEANLKFLPCPEQVNRGQNRIQAFDFILFDLSTKWLFLVRNKCLWRKGQLWQKLNFVWPNDVEELEISPYVWADIILSKVFCSDWGWQPDIQLPWFFCWDRQWPGSCSCVLCRFVASF